MMCPTHEAPIKARETHCAFIAAYLMEHGREPVIEAALTEAQAFERFEPCRKGA